MNKSFIKQVSAKASGEVHAACQCDLMNHVEDDKDDVQLFPPGKHAITAKMDGEPVELTVDIGEAQANVIKQDFDKMLAAAKSGKGPKPFLDFNHDDREAAAWPSEVYWAGNDPVTGGVRAKVEWSKPGKDAVNGKAYRQFSPNFLIDTRTKQIIGTTPNMGGLVNRPAFRAIQPFFAKDGEDKPATNPTMKKLTALLASFGLISAANAENDDAASAEFAEKFKVVKASADEAASVKAEVATLKAKHAEVSESHAEALVVAAVAEGRIAAKDTETREGWKTLIKADPKHAKLLASIAVVAAKEDPTGKRVINPDPAKDKGQQAGAEDGHPLVVLAKEIAKRDKLTENAALVKAAEENPKLYEDYRGKLIAARN